MEEIDARVFLELKSYCDNLMKNPTENNAYKLAKVINDSNVVIQYLSEYCLFPIITSLQVKNLSMNVKEELIRTMRVIIQKVRIKKITHFNQIYGSLLIQLYDKTQSHQVIASHEELKEQVALCLKDIINRSYTDVIALLYLKENTLKLGQGILLCLTIARTEKSQSVRLAAINAVMALCQIDDSQIVKNKFDIILQDQVADTIMAFLPGIVSGLQEIAMGGEVQHHKITMMAVRAWGRIISLIMCDKEKDILPIEELVKKSHNLSTDSQNNITYKKFSMKESLKEVTRNQEWLEVAAIKLNTCIQLLDKITCHSHSAVRLEVVKSISLILQKCPRNMKPNIMTLIDHLISLSEDESTDVSQKARSMLKTISEDYMLNYNMKSLIYLLEERFYDLLTRLPTVVRWSDDNKQLVSLNQFSGYLRLLGKQRLPHVMRSQAHMRRLLLAFIHIMSIDCNEVTLLQTENVRNLDDPAYFYGSDLWRQFKFIKNTSCKEKLVAVCRLLGELGDFRLLVDAILELMSDAPQYRKELSLLLNWTIVSVKDSSVLHLYKEIINFYTTDETWYLSIEVTEDTSLTQAQSNIVQCCLLTEGLGYIAQNLQSNYDTYLQKTLYLVIERAGSRNSLISYVGTCALESIAVAQQHKTIGDLLRANVDYFSYPVIIKLRKVECNPGVLDVVEVIMKYSKIDFLPYLKKIVEDILGQLNVPFYKRNTYSFLRIFYTFIVCIKALVECEDKKATKKENTQAANNPSETIILSLLEYYNAKKINERLEEDINETYSNISDTSNNELPEEMSEKINYADIDSEDKQEKTLPTHIKIIVDIMKRCLHFLPSKDVQQSLMAMQTFQVGLTMLVEWENELLPLVHQLWHPLIDRFNNKNVVLMNHAWQLLHVLANISNDFIRNRTLREVMPSVSKFLVEFSKESLDKNSADIYKFTQNYKLQYELLSTLGLVARLLRLRERELWELLSNTQMYLNAQQNTILQTCCVKLYKDIADYHGDIVWVKCLSIWNSKVTRIASDETFDIKIIMDSNITPSNEYYKNIREIIAYIQKQNIQC